MALKAFTTRLLLSSTFISIRWITPTKLHVWNPLFTLLIRSCISLSEAVSIEVSMLIRLKMSECSLLMRRTNSLILFSSTKSCNSSAKRIYSQSSLNFVLNLNVLSSSKCPVKRLTSLRRRL